MGDLEIFLFGSAASFIAAFAGIIGGMIVFLKKSFSEKQLNNLFGFAGGIILAAAVFSFIMPSLEIGGVFVCSAGILIGALGVIAFNKVSGHHHLMDGKESINPQLIKKIWIYVMALAVHNLPEGMAAGISFGGGDRMFKDAILITTALIILNIPEGAADAIVFLKEGYTRQKAFKWMIIIGLIEALGGVAGAAIVSVFDSTYSFFLAFTAGAMLYHVIEKIIPESHTEKKDNKSALYLIIGFLIMVIIEDFLH